MKEPTVVAQGNAIVDYLATLTTSEDDALRNARDRAGTGGMPPVATPAGAFLRVAARWSNARTAVEVGSGAGYSGIWIARGLPAGGVLTTIEANPEHQRLAKASYAEAGVAGKVRSIVGSALEVLPRLSDGHYDLMFIDAVKAEYPDYLEHALRLVRPGGVILADNVLWSGKVADPGVSDADTEGLRTYNRRISEDERLVSAILEIGDGLAVSVVAGAEAG